jgi:uncharacterized coiled-coil protein SlyX
MTLNDAITKLRVMLGAEAEVATEVKMADISLIDGTELFTEGELVVGAVLLVKVAEGEAPFAPAGMHETVDGMILTVGENGVIEAIEEKVVEAAPATEAPATEEAPATDTQMAADPEALLAAIAELISGYQAEVAAEVAQVNEEMKALTERFNAVAGSPAAKPVKRNFMEEASAAKEVELARFNKLVALRKQNLNK